MAIVTACCLGMIIASTTKAPDDPSAPAATPTEPERVLGPSAVPSVRVVLPRFEPTMSPGAAGPLPVRWNRAKYPWITSVADCERLWRTHPVGGEPPSDTLFLQKDFEDREGTAVRTCAEFRAAHERGYGAMSNYSHVEASSWQFADGILSTLPALEPSTRSTFDGADLVADARRLLPPKVRRNELRFDPDAPSEWTIEGGEITRSDIGYWEILRPVAFGDLDGDGWEDMLATRYGGFEGGTGRQYEVMAFARRHAGRLYDISNRIFGGAPSEEAIKADRRAWQANLGLPKGRRITIAGTCDCTEDRREDSHPASLTVQLDQGYADGHYSCAKQPQRVPVAGCFSESGTTFVEYGIDDVPTARFHFLWKLDGDILELDGYRCESGHMEIDNVKLRYSVAAPEAPVTAPR